MKKMMFFVLLVVAFAAGRGSAGVAAPEKTVVARVNGVDITEQQIEEAVDELVPRAYFHGNMTPERRAKFRPEALDKLIDEELYFQEATRIGMEPDPGEVDSGFKTVKARFRNDSDFRKALKASGLTVEQLMRNIRRELLIRKFQGTEITAKASVTEDFVRGYYEQNKKEFMRPEAFHLRHILIKVEPTAADEERVRAKKKAEELLARARAGEDFHDLAYYNSMDDWRVKGGDIGLIHRGRLEPELEKAAAELEVGKISNVIETIYGYHIIRLEGKLPPTQLSFDEVKAGLTKRMEERRTKEIREALLKRLKEHAKIETY